MNEREFDVIVLGAGPAGATAATVLAQQGRRVLILDRAKFPRKVPCGGWLTGEKYYTQRHERNPCKCY